tara:strand:- start:1711 stop:2247 length:537 start_codon:yes stop_codon:yes gene_type:complete
VASDKNFFDQLNTKTIGDNAASTVQALSNPVHLQSSNKELLDAIIQVNRAGMRDAGQHIPATSSIKTATATESGTRVTIDFGGDGGSPSKGEVWAISAMTIESVAGGSGDVTYEIFVGDGTELQSVVKRAQTSPPVHLNQELEYPHGLEIDENLTLQFSATRSSLSAAKIQVLTYRIR